MRSCAVASHFYQICQACVLWDWVTALWSVSQTATGFVSAVHAASRSGQTEASVINWKVMDWRQRWGRHYSAPVSVLWNMGIPENREFRCMTCSALCRRNISPQTTALYTVCEGETGKCYSLKNDCSFQIKFGTFKSICYVWCRWHQM